MAEVEGAYGMSIAIQAAKVGEDELHETMWALVEKTGVEPVRVGAGRRPLLYCSKTEALLDAAVDEKPVKVQVHIVFPKPTGRL